MIYIGIAMQDHL